MKSSRLASSIFASCVALVAIGSGLLYFRDHASDKMPGATQERKTRPARPSDTQPVEQKGVGAPKSGHSTPETAAGAPKQTSEPLALPGGQQEFRRNAARRRARALASEDLNCVELLALLLAAQHNSDGIEFGGVLAVLRLRLSTEANDREALMNDLRRADPEALVHGFPSRQLAILICSIPGADTAKFVEGMILREPASEDSYFLLGALGQRAWVQSPESASDFPDDQEQLGLERLAFGPCGVDEAGRDMVVKFLCTPTVSGEARKMLFSLASCIQSPSWVRQASPADPPLQEVTRTLIEVARLSGSSSDRQAALRALGASSAPEAQAVLIETIRCSSIPAEQAAAALALANASDDPLVYAALLEGCSSNTDPTPLKTILSYIRPAPNQDTAFVQRIALIARQSTEPSIRCAAVTALSRGGNPAIEPLRHISLNDPAEAVRLIAAARLAELVKNTAPPGDGYQAIRHTLEQSGMSDTEIEEIVDKMKADSDH